jgi:electron transfer flavoprotein beta subunit
VALSRRRLRGGVPPVVSARPPRIGAALKWQPLRPEVDLLTGTVAFDERLMGASEADLAALECALRLADAWGGEVAAACAGPAGADAMLRDALAAGAGRAVRCQLRGSSSSAAAAAALAHAFNGFDVIVCGDHSRDRGSGSVPALLAAELGAAQALGLVKLEPDGASSILAERRLDGGRRERLRVRPPSVLSVEGATARLRRAPLRGVLRAGHLEVERVDAASRARDAAPARGRLRPYRPRARALDPPDPELPARERILQLTGALAARSGREVVRAEPPKAAEQLLDALRAWGYIE